MPDPLRHQRLLLVEGKDEVNFITAIRSHLNITNVEIRSFEGNDNLRPFLVALRNIEGFETVLYLGIIRDAEGNGNAAIESIRGALHDAGYSAPATALTLSAPNPRVAFLVNPFGRPDGRFDDVCAQAVRETPIMACVERYIACLKDLKANVPRREWKTRVHAYIAAQ